MDIINQGTDDLKELSVISCCFPPGTETLESPEKN